MKHRAAYPEIVEGRPDLDWYRSDRSTSQFGVTMAKRFPKYVHGRIGFSALLHKIEYVTMHWYTPTMDGHNLQKLISPYMTAHTVCGMMFGISGTKAKTCELPSPETVLCGRCHGTGSIWGRGKNPTITKKEAKVRLSCIAKGDSV